ncbi:MAG: glycosyltransferase [Sphingobacteriales bacterium]|nr:glycosyltransferase [Sphingobacteriales bacterium]
MISKHITVHIIISHPKGNGTFTHRIKSFKNALELNGLKVKIPHILYPFETYYQGISKEINIIPEKSLIIIKPKSNLIQNTTTKLQKLTSGKILIKILYALNILLYKIDLWYVPLFKSYTINHLEDNIIIASGGPGSVFRMGYELANNSNSKLILDYRDPWNLGYNLLETGSWINKFKRKIMLKTELQILEYAHHITTVSESLKSFFPKKYHHKITVIENGSNFEQDEIIDLINPTPSKFNITYLGTIYHEQLFEEDFFKAFSQFYHDKADNYKNHIRLNFIGSDKNDRLKLLIKKYDLNEATVITKRLKQEDLLKYLVNASLFLHLRFKGRSKIITSKIADYLMFRKPILLPISDDGDIAETIRKYKAGYVCSNYLEVVNTLENEFQGFLNKEDITLRKGDFSCLSRSEIANKLIELIKGLEESNPPSL